MIWHLPGGVPTNSSKQVRIVSLCGRRGPIRARDQFEPGQGELLNVPVAFPVCQGCAVVWDKAEEAGKLLQVWTSNGNREWKGSGSFGAALQEPARRPWRSYYGDGTPKDRRLVVVMRTERAPVIVSASKKAGGAYAPRPEAGR